MLLDTEWDEAVEDKDEESDADQMGDDENWPYSATVKIFSSEDEYRNYQNGQND